MSTRNNPVLGIMPQRVWRRAATAVEIGRLDGLGKGAGQDIGGDGTGSPAIGEEPARIAVVLGLPHSPQAAAVNQAETAAVYGIAHGGENAPHFGMGKRLRQPPLLGKPDLFLNRTQSWPSVFR